MRFLLAYANEPPIWPLGFSLAMCREPEEKEKEADPSVPSHLYTGFRPLCSLPVRIRSKRLVLRLRYALRLLRLANKRMPNRRRLRRCGCC